jgi:hypothetical protein
LLNEAWRINRTKVQYGYYHPYVDIKTTVMYKNTMISCSFYVSTKSS